MPIFGPTVPGMLLFRLSGANLQLTTDQTFTRLFTGTNYMPTNIIARQRSGAASIACMGGIYDGAAKSGNIIALAATNWVALAAAVPVVVPLANLLQTAILSATPILSLTTGSTAACTADIFIFGVDIS